MLFIDQASRLYAEIAAAAESGWDFSTRWFRPGGSTLQSLDTQNKIPIDLNAFLCWNTRILADLHALIGSTLQLPVYMSMPVYTSIYLAKISKPYGCVSQVALPRSEILDNSSDFENCTLVSMLLSHSVYWQEKMTPTTIKLVLSLHQCLGCRPLALFFLTSVSAPILHRDSSSLALVLVCSPVSQIVIWQLM